MGREERQSNAHTGGAATATTRLPSDTRPDTRPTGDRARGPGLWERLKRRLSRRPAAAREVEQALAQALLPEAERLTEPRSVGEGGMATVEAIVDGTLRRRMARKRLLPELQGDLRAVRSFVREAQITGQLDHPNIVPVYDLGETDDGRLFFTMKLLAGRTLTEVVRGLPPGELDRAALFDLLEIVLKVCDALAFAHQRRVLHRDVKPDNVMIGDFGQVYLVDWGLARLIHDEPGGAEQGTEPVSSSFERIWGDTVVGTPGFMSPEQAGGGHLDERADVFSVGATLYFVLTRKPPYEGSSSDSVFRRAMSGKIAPLRDAMMHGAVPRELDRIVTRALAPLPEDRYQSLSELREDLVTFMRGGSLPRVRFEAGDQIIREGDVGEEAYIIVDGRCEAFRTVGGRRESIRTMGPGESFGEMAIISDSPRTAGVVALETTTVERLTRQELLEEMDVVKPWVSVLLRTLAERFTEQVPPEDG